MPSLLNTLQGHDLSFINMVANAWGISLNAPDLQKARPIVINALKDANLVLEMIEALPNEARDALNHLAGENGILPWAQFSRDFGDVRVMGAAKRDRERPDLNPISPAEVLWYRALIGRAFLKLNNEPQEYAYIPDEILEGIPDPQHKQPILPGRPASPGETKNQVPVTDMILDDCTTILAALRIGIDLESIQQYQLETNLSFVLSLLHAGGMITPNNSPQPEVTKYFLDQAREKALTFLVNTWLENKQINEVLFTPQIEFETEPDINPSLVRKKIMDLLSLIPEEHWWNLDSFVQFIYHNHPDFLRQAGDYDAWFVKDRQNGNYLRGFQTWNQVEEKFLIFFITKVLYWLGFVELAHAENKPEISAFRLSAWSKSLWNGQSPQILSTQPAKIQLDRYGLFKIPQQASLVLRYQISRFCEWEDKKEGIYYYRITPKALQTSADQGLKINHLFLLLQNQLKDPFPPSLQKALLNWEQTREYGKISAVQLLRVPSPEILTRLQEGKSKRLIEEIISPTVAIIRPGQEQAIRKALFDLGIIVNYSLE